MLILVRKRSTQEHKPVSFSSPTDHHDDQRNEKRQRTAVNHIKGIIDLAHSYIAKHHRIRIRVSDDLEDICLVLIRNHRYWTADDDCYQPHCQDLAGDDLFRSISYLIDYELDFKTSNYKTTPTFNGRLMPKYLSSDMTVM
jgi:hypothetical protein